MRADGIGKRYQSLGERIIAECREYCDKVDRGEIQLPRDANGNIIPTPSTRKPNVFDGLNLTRDNPAEIGWINLT